MFSEVRKRAKKTGQPPGTPVYTGTQREITPLIHVISYNQNDCRETSGASLEDCLPNSLPEGITWVDVQGLHNTAIIEKISERFNLHPLTTEDILNVEQ